MAEPGEEELAGDGGQAAQGERAEPDAVSRLACSPLTSGARRLYRARPSGVDLPRVFRTADYGLIHAADCCSRYSLWTCCGVRY